MKRWVVAGALWVGCATVGQREDGALYEPKAPVRAAAAAAPAVAKRVEMPVTAEVRLEPVGDSAARASGRFGIDRGVVTLDLVFTNVPMGAHAVALQDRCDGEHWNPTNSKHGRFDAPPFHLGDVGNFFANESGQGSITFSTELWSVGTGLPNDVVDKVVVARARRDDFSGQPYGGAGDVIACGRIELAQLRQPAVSMTGRLIETLR